MLKALTKAGEGNDGVEGRWVVLIQERATRTEQAT